MKTRGTRTRTPKESIADSVISRSYLGMSDEEFDELRRDVEDIETDVRRQLRNVVWESAIPEDRITATEREVDEDEGVSDTKLRTDSGG